MYQQNRWVALSVSFLSFWVFRLMKQILLFTLLVLSASPLCRYGVTFAGSKREMLRHLARENEMASVSSLNPQPRFGDDYTNNRPHGYCLECGGVCGH